MVRAVEFVGWLEDELYERVSDDMSVEATFELRFGMVVVMMRSVGCVASIGAGGVRAGCEEPSREGRWRRGEY